MQQNKIPGSSNLARPGLSRAVPIDQNKIPGESGFSPLHFSKHHPKDQNAKMIRVLIIMCALFSFLIIYLTYFEFFENQKIISSTYNQRRMSVENNTLRGRIYDRKGTLLADSRKTGDKQERIYPFGSLYSDVIGYSSKVYGKSLLEAKFNDYLLNIRDDNILQWKDRLSTKEKTGNDLYLTLDHRLQVLASNLLGKRKGAIVAMNPKTGEILAMVSKPDFNPDSRSLAEKWRELVDSDDHPFLPRATQGLYAPGSTFKVLMSALAIENGMGDRTFTDQGSVTIDGKKIKNSGGKAYGEIDLRTALTVSCNSVFSQLGVDLGEQNLKGMAQRAFFEEDIPFDLPLSKSLFPYHKMKKTDMAAVGIGQGKILISPLHMAMITSCIADKGIMMKPVLVKRVASRDGRGVKSFGPTVLNHVLSSETADQVKDMMHEVVQSGTGKNAAIQGISVAGKTGTAENEMAAKEANKEHNWFIGFAPVENPKIAVVVVTEYSGSTGGSLCAPMAKEIMANYLRNN